LCAGGCASIVVRLWPPNEAADEAQVYGVEGSEAGRRTKMNRRALLPSSALGIALLLLAGSAEAGVVVKYSDGTEIAIQGGKIRSSGEGGTAIIEVKTGAFAIIDDEKKTYAESTVDEVCDSMQKLFEQMTKNLPPEQLEMMKKMMKMRAPSGQAPKVKVERAGDGGEIAGYKTVKYKVYSDGKLYEELWIAENTPVQKELQDVGAAEFLSKKFENCMAGPSKVAPEALVEAGKEYQKLFKRGWAMRRVEYDPETGEQASSEEVVSLEERKLPASDFEVPKDYKKVTFVELMGGMMGR